MKQRREEIQFTTARVVERLAAIRTERGLSLRKLATMAGVTQPGLALVEKGERKPTLHFLLQICKALEIEIWPILRDAEKQGAKNR